VWVKELPTNFKMLTKRISCPCCKGVKLKKKYSLEYKDQKMLSFLNNYYGKNIKDYLNKIKNYQYNIKECFDCSTIFQEFVPDNAFGYELYENIISKKNSIEKKTKYDLKNFEFFFKEIKILKKFFKKKNFEIKVLEFGAGWGFWSRFMKSLNFQIFTNELSLTRIKFIKRNNINNILNLKKSKETFDIIYSDQVFEHLNHPNEILNLLISKLNKNGLIYLKFPNSFNFRKNLNKNYVPTKDALHPLEHINLFNIKSFRAMLKNRDFSILNIDKYRKFDFKKHLILIKNLFRFDKILIKKNS